MTSRPSVEGLDSISGAFDLNTEAAPAVTQGNSVDETAVGATADGAGTHRNAGSEEINDSTDYTMVAARTGQGAGGRTVGIEVPAEKYTERINRGHDYRDKEAVSTHAEDGNSRNGTSLADAAATTAGSVGAEYATDVPAMSTADMNLKLSLTMGASGNEDSKRENICDPVDVDARMIHTPKSFGDQKQENDTKVQDVASDKMECECETIHTEAPRNVERPILKCMVTGNDPETSQLVSYSLPQNHRKLFRASDLIWGKVKSHPWWPGQIVDQSFASELALKHQRKGSHLVAYFGDKTFAWCEDSQLKPFSTFFSQMEKQSSNEGFRDAVTSSLHEVSRRVQMGMVCSCVPKRLYSKLKVHKFDSAGVREGVAVALVDKPECLQIFQPDNFLQYISNLARFPTCHASQFDITVAHAQLMAYNRLEGRMKCSAVGTAKGRMEAKVGSAEIPVPPPTSISDYDDTLLCNLTSMKTRSKSGISKKRKPVQEDDRKEKSSSQHVGFKRKNRLEDRVGFGKRAKSLAISPIDSGNSKTKKRMLNLFESVDAKSPLPTPKNFVIGECISRVASKLTSLPHNLKSVGDPLLKNKDKADPEYDGPFSLDTSIPLSEQRHLKNGNYENMLTSELLSRFVSMASDPFKADIFCPITVSFFSDVRLLLVSMSNVPKEVWKVDLDEWDFGSSEPAEPQKGIKRKRGRPKLVSYEYNNSFPEGELKTHSEIKRKRGRPPKSSLTKNNKKSCLTKNDKKSLEGIKPPQTVKRKRGRPPKNIREKNVKSHEEDGGNRGMRMDDKKPCEEDANKDARVVSVPIHDESVLLMPDYLNDSYWTDVVVQNSSKKRKRGRKRREETLIKSTDSKLKPEDEPPVFRDPAAISDAQTHHISSVSHSESNGLDCKRKITYFGEKSVEELNPTALVLNFSALCSLPSEIDLVRIFSRYGPLKESDTELQTLTRRAIVVFKRRADAEVAFKEVPFSRFGPALIDFCLKNLPLQSGNTQEVVGARCTAPVDSGNSEHSGSKKELFQGGSFQHELTNTKFGETSSTSSTVDNLKENLPNATSNFQTAYNAECQTSIDIFFADYGDPRRDGGKGQTKLGLVENNGNEMPVDDGNFVISCDPEQSKRQSSSVTANTFQNESAGCDNVEILVEESCLNVDMVQVPCKEGGSTRYDERGCSLLHSTGIEALEFCSTEKIAHSGGMHEMDDLSPKNKKPGCGPLSESLVVNKSEVSLDTYVAVSVKDSMSADIYQMGDQDMKIEESNVGGSNLYDSANTSIISVHACNFEGVERDRKKSLDNATTCDGKLHDSADCFFQSLGSAETPVKVELMSAEVQGQKVCQMIPFDSEMEVLTAKGGETKLHVTGKHIADIKDSRHSLTCEGLVSDSGKEQATQYSRNPYILGTSKENSVMDLKSDITDLRLQSELKPETERLMNFQFASDLH